MEFKTAVHEGVTYTMPVPESEKEIPLGVARRIRKIKGEQEQASELMFSLMESFLTEDELEKWDALTADQIPAVMAAFEEDAEVAGEVTPLKD